MKTSTFCLVTMAGPATRAVRTFKDLLYGLYADAGHPSLSTVADGARIVAEELGDKRGPSRFTVGAMLSTSSGLPSEEYAVIVGSALARLAGRDPCAVSGEVRAAWQRARTASRTLSDRRPGVPVSSADPLVLGVHRTTGPGSGRHASLPAYLCRPHDDAVASIVDAARAGASGVMALVGTPCSGRARAAWEAVRTLPELWRIWQPDVAPSASAELVTALADAGPYTIIWLTGAPLPDLDASPTGQSFMHALRTLVDDPGRAPVLLVVTLWPQQWTELTAPPPPGEPDVHAATRSLLYGNDIVVPETFTAEQTQAARTGADPVLRRAATDAADGRITQFLAGVPGMLRRYQDAPPATRAVIDAAVDARRLGFPPQLPAAFLRYVAAGAASTTEEHRGGYTDRVQPWDDEFAAAIEYTTATGPDEPALLVADSSAAPPAARHYRLAEHLLYVGTAQRAAVFPPARFWDALATTVTDPGALLAVGARAERRGRFGRAGQAYQLAVERADVAAMVRLAVLRERARDHRGADRLATQAGERGEHTALAWLADRADERGDHRRADALARAAAENGDAGLACRLAERHPGSARAEALYRAALQHATLQKAVNQHAVNPAAGNCADNCAGGLAATAHGRGDLAEAERFARQAASAGDTTELRRLAETYRRAAAVELAEQLAVAAAAYGHAFERRLLTEEQRRHGKRHAVESFLSRAAGGAEAGHLRRITACLGTDTNRALGMVSRLASRRHTGPLRALAVDRQRRGEPTAAQRLAVAAARCGDPSVLAEIAAMTARAGDLADGVRLAERAAALGDGSALRKLARSRRRAGDAEAAIQLLRQACSYGDPDARFELALALHQAGDLAGAEAQYRNAARGGVADASLALALLVQDTDAPAAADFARKAAELGHPTALRDLGQARERAGDLAAAAALYRQGSDRGDDTSARLLAQLWDRHHHRSAIRLATRAAEQGNPAPLRHLAGLRARTGRRAEADALYWSAYEHGDSAVLMDLPHMRVEDRGDPVRAEQLALRAAGHGHHRAVADLGAVRELTGDLAGAEQLYLCAVTAGLDVDLRQLIRLRLASAVQPTDQVMPLYEHAFKQGVAGASLVLARRHLDQGNHRDATALCLHAANLGDPAALPELVRLNRALGDNVTADLIEQYGLRDDGSAANAFLW